MSKNEGFERELAANRGESVPDEQSQALCPRCGARSYAEGGEICAACKDQAREARIEGAYDEAATARANLTRLSDAQLLDELTTIGATWRQRELIGELSWRLELTRRQLDDKN